MTQLVSLNVCMCRQPYLNIWCCCYKCVILRWYCISFNFYFMILQPAKTAAAAPVAPALPRQTVSKVSQELLVVKSLLTAAFISHILPYWWLQHANSFCVLLAITWIKRKNASCMYVSFFIGPSSCNGSSKAASRHGLCTVWNDVTCHIDIIHMR